MNSTATSMLLIDAGNAESYLRDTGRIASHEPIVVRELAGGVSNIVLLVAHADGKPCFVLKQVREQLRVPDPWYCSIERIWREVEVLEVCHRALTNPAATDEQSGAGPDPRSRCATMAVAVPAVVFCDRENYLYAMTAAPEHEVWKSQLLRGDANPLIAAACGQLLGVIHAATWLKSDVATRLADTGFFDALRLDPYYRHVARQHAELAPPLSGLIDSLAKHPRCLVHGDFSPKNILVHADSLTLVDFEVGHYGDPAFDLGFFLSHLILKAIRAGDRWREYVSLTNSFWLRYEKCLRPKCGDLEFAALVVRTIGQFAGCVLARVEGKSRVDYLTRDHQESARNLAKDLLSNPVSLWSDVVQRLEPLVAID